jgi:cellulose synthase/poly-beta-1,6-N-acetylglucosamine synthase-like glycosyltransferase
MDFRAVLIISMIGACNLAGWISWAADGKPWGLATSLSALVLLSIHFLRRPGLSWVAQSLTAAVLQATLTLAALTLRSWIELSGQNWSEAFLWAALMAVQALLSWAAWKRAVAMADVIGRKEARGFSLDPLPQAGEGSFAPMVSIHVPCCREPPEVVIASLDCLARLEYPRFEVLVIDNNTMDPALWRPVEEHCRKLGIRFRFFSLGEWPGYKAGALNYGLRHTDPDAELIAVVDADWQVEPNWLDRIVPYFRDSQLASVQGALNYRDGTSSLFKKMILDETCGPSRVTLADRSDDNVALLLGSMTLLSRRALEEVGGWSEELVGEDVELGLRLLGSGRKMIYLKSSVCGCGLLPKDFSSYARQRQRWCHAAIQIFRHHRDLLTGKKGALKPAQRRHFILDWLRMAALGLYPCFVAAAILGGFLLVQKPELRDFPPSSFLIAALFLVILYLADRFWVYDLRLKFGKRRIFLMMLAELSLMHSVAKAAWRGFLNKPLVFDPTARYKNRHSFIESFSKVGGPVAMTVACLGACLAILVVFGFSSARGLLLAASLIFVTLPYFSTVAANAIDYFCTSEGSD